MNHDKTIISFISDDDKTYSVEYFFNYTINKRVFIEKKESLIKNFDVETLQANVYEGKKLIRVFNPVPKASIRSLTHLQAKDLIFMALDKNKKTKKKNS